MPHQTITSDQQLAAFCEELASAKVIGLDTEFVSESTYWSNLSLIQVTAGGKLAVIDPYEVDDLKPFWELLTQGDHVTVVHAGREEVMFCLRAVGCSPARLFDIQIAAGLVGYDYPAGYGSLVFKLLGQRPAKGETRTDWRRRPLSEQQIAYAIGDVRFLLQAYEKLTERLETLERTGWMTEEMNAWQEEVTQYQTRPRWRKVSGISGLSRRSLSIVRELWTWREAEAQRLDRPPKRVLRDDLILELAKRASAEPKQILAIRGFDQGGLRRAVPELAQCIAQALEAPQEEHPKTNRRELPPQLNVIGQFLTAALTSICRRAEVAPSIVGTATNVRELIADRLGFDTSRDGSLPVLATGWRAEVVGNQLDQLLTGKLSIRIQDPRSEDPLGFEPAASDP